MKRLFHQTRIYDYQKVTEADKHIKEMESKGWKVKIHDGDFGDQVYNNGQTEYSWSVEFYKTI